MLLCVDVGNTNIVIGVFNKKKIAGHWRIRTEKDATADETGILICSLFNYSDIEMKEIDSIIISSVVPPVLNSLEDLASRYFNIKPMVVNPALKTGMPIIYDNPNEVGADRIVNSVAAYEKYGTGLIIVDFGTATTFDCVTPEGAWTGGVIAPGIIISSDALFEKTARLPRVEMFTKPERVVARNTVSAINVGIVYGYTSLVDGIVNRIKKELAYETKVIATGGVAKLIAEYSETIDITDEFLTLEGLRILYERNI